VDRQTAQRNLSSGLALASLAFLVFGLAFLTALIIS
jgi:hypothetical protein